MTLNANKRLALKLALIPLLMFGFGYAQAPLYNVICKITGINGKTGVISRQEAAMETVDAKRTVTVEFDTNVNNRLPWKFRPLQPRMKVHPGAINAAMFYTENLSNFTAVGQAIPSVVPNAAAVFFNKTACFCFTQQILGPGEHRNMPVQFIIDPKLPQKIKTLTLSYTFFRVPGTEAGTAAGRIDQGSEKSNKTI